MNSMGYIKFVKKQLISTTNWTNFIYKKLILFLIHDRIQCNQ